MSVRVTRLYFGCIRCREYMRADWPQYPAWLRTHRAHGGNSIFLHGVRPRAGFKCSLSPVEQLALEGVVP